MYQQFVIYKLYEKETSNNEYISDRNVCRGT
jgi:hypothetical protein